MAAPAQRPALGRPSSSNGQNQTDLNPSPPPTQSPEPVPAAPPFGAKNSKQTRSDVAISQNPTHATSNTDGHVPASVVDDGSTSGPPPFKPFSRPVRSTRNPNPAYIDAFAPAAWSASPVDIRELNKSISRRNA